MATRSVLILILFFFALASVAAQGADNDGGKAGGIGFGPQLGIYKSQDSDGARLMGGAALRIKFSEVLGVEASINYRQEEYSNGFVNVKSWPVMVTGLLYPIPIVYGAVGAGWYNTTVNYNFPAGFLGGPTTLASETHQEFGWHFGGGLELPVGSVAKLVGDIRYVFLNYEFERFPGTNDVNSDFYVITVGLLFGL